MRDEDTERSINAAIARLTFMTHGKIGRDWGSGMPFVLYDKGNEFDALLQAISALRQARATLERVSYDNRFSDI